MLGATSWTIRACWRPVGGGGRHRRRGLHGSRGRSHRDAHPLGSVASPDYGLATLGNVVRNAFLGSVPALEHSVGEERDEDHICREPDGGGLRGDRAESTGSSTGLIYALALQRAAEITCARSSWSRSCWWVLQRTEPPAAPSGVAAGTTGSADSRGAMTRKRRKGDEMRSTSSQSPCVSQSSLRSPARRTTTAVARQAARRPAPGGARQHAAAGTEPGGAGVRSRWSWF